MDQMLVFVGVIFLMVSIYLIIFVESPAAKFVGGEILSILAIFTLIKGFEPK